MKGNRKPSGPQGKDVFNSSSGPRAKVLEKFGTGSSLNIVLRVGEIKGIREKLIHSHKVTARFRILHQVS